MQSESLADYSSVHTHLFDVEQFSSNHHRGPDQHTSQHDKETELVEVEQGGGAAGCRSTRPRRCAATASSRCAAATTYRSRRTRANAEERRTTGNQGHRRRRGTDTYEPALALTRSPSGLGCLLECSQAVGAGLDVYPSHHPGIAVRAWKELFAEEPYRRLIIRDGDIPLGERGRIRRDEDPAGIESARQRLARGTERRLSDAVVPGDATELESHDGAVGGVDVVGYELEDATRGVHLAAHGDHGD